MHPLTEDMMKLKSVSCYLLNEFSLTNCESQVTNRLCSLADAIILGSAKDDANVESVTENSYILIKTIEIKNMLKGYDRKKPYAKHIKNILKVLDSLDLSEQETIKE